METGVKQTVRHVLLECKKKETWLKIESQSLSRTIKIYLICGNGYHRKQY